MWDRSRQRSRSDEQLSIRNLEEAMLENVRVKLDMPVLFGAALFGFAANVAIAQQSPPKPAPSKPATAATKAAKAAVMKALPFNDKEDFEDAQRGFIAKPEVITIKGANGKVVWTSRATSSTSVSTSPRPTP
jgi:hypothetical protein